MRESREKRQQKSPSAVVCAKVKPVAFHRHFTAISPFADAPNAAVKQKAPFLECRMQGAEFRIPSDLAKKTRRLRGLGSQLETACLFARWHAA